MQSKLDQLIEKRHTKAANKHCKEIDDLIHEFRIDLRSLQEPAEKKIDNENKYKSRHIHIYRDDFINNQS